MSVRSPCVKLAAGRGLFAGADVQPMKTGFCQAVGCAGHPAAVLTYSIVPCRVPERKPNIDEVCASVSNGFQAFLNSRVGVGIALTLGQTLPVRLGHPLAKFLGGLVAGRRRTAIVRAVRLNQWVVTGQRLSGRELDEVVRATFRHTARCQYDLYHNLQNGAATLRMVQLGPRLEKLVERMRAGEGSAVLAGVHLSNFDLAARAAALRGLRVQVLSYGDPGPGYEWQNAMRRRVGLDVTPVSMSSLRSATERLGSGGYVLTGFDRPLRESKHRVMFFGHEAAMPDGHVRLALKANVPVIVLAATLTAEGLYVMEASDPVAMEPEADREAEIRNNVERVLRVAEPLIEQAAQQWAMFFPVWPDLLHAVPDMRYGEVDGRGADA